MPGDEKLDNLLQEIQRGLSLLEGSSLKEVLGEDEEKEDKDQKNPMVLHAKLSSMFFTLQERRTP